MGRFKFTVCDSALQNIALLILVSDTWFRILVKAVSQNNASYTWHEMTFCSRWESQRCIVLCIGVDLAFQHLFQETLSGLWPKLPSYEPFSLHVPLLHTILDLQDSSIWSIRDVIRNIEKASVT
jgi:hypothetical protein